MRPGVFKPIDMVTNPGKQEESQDQCLVAVIWVFMVFYFLVFIAAFTE
jgi:hypothetical protein